MKNARPRYFALCLLLALSLAACDLASVSEPEEAEPAALRQAERLTDSGTPSLPALNEARTAHTPAGLIVDIHAPLQTVEARRNEERFPARFAARIRVLPGGTAQGRLRLHSRVGGLALVLEAVGGQGHFGPDGTLERVDLAFVTPDGALVQATVTPDAGVPGCDIWDFMSNGVHDVDNVSFDATGRIVVRRTLLLRYSRQTVEAERNEEHFPARFAARVELEPEGTARGQLRLRSREGGLALVLEAVGGQGHFGPDGTLERVALELVTPDGALVQATVTPEAGVPGCDVWDFMSNGVHDVDNVSFDATGRIVVR